MTAATINKLEDLLKDHVGPSRKLVDVKIEKLPPAGVGSIMLKISGSLKSEDGPTKEEINAVAKILPSSELTRKIFDVQTTFKIEIEFYDTILPILENFRIRNGVKPLECFAKFYGARINLDGSDAVTDDCVLVLENLIVAGFKNVNRLEGFDLETTKLVLTDLARFHGTAMSFRIKHQDLFRSEILPLCVDLKSKNPDETPDRSIALANLLKAIVGESEKSKHLVNVIDDLGFRRSSKDRPTGPFATVTHCDLWSNNTMQRFVDGKAVENKFVDWQCYAYKSCVNDLIFALFTSVQVKVLEHHLDSLLEYYHGQLIGTLRELRCDTSSLGYERFLEEIRYETGVQKEYMHVLCFITFVKREVRLSETSFAEMRANPTENVEEVVKVLPMELKKAVWLFMDEGEKRGWLGK